VRCEYAHDDGAYVLGALSPAERATYERHLGSCPACREAVAEIAVLPGLLGRLDSATALQMLAEDRSAEDVESGQRRWPMNSRDDDDARVTSLVSAAARLRRRDRRRTQLRYASVALAAACVALAFVFGAGIMRDMRSPGTGGTGTGGTEVRLEAMKPVSSDLPITARVGLEDRGWGTEVTMECAYEKTDHYAKAWRLKLVAYGPDGESEQIGSWVAGPGKSVDFTGVTRFSGDQLARLELARSTGESLLVYDVP
jgi:hypothetical protein